MRKYVLDPSQYSYNSSTKSFTLPWGTELKDILLITDVTLGKVIYNFACTEMTGSFINNVLTLNGDTTGTTSSDEFIIIMQGESIVEPKIELIERIARDTQSNTKALIKLQEETNNLLKLILS